LTGFNIVLLFLYGGEDIQTLVGLFKKKKFIFSIDVREVISLIQIP